MNPVVKAHYSLPTLTESDIYLVGMWGLEHTSNLDFRSIIENYATDEDLARLLSARSAEKIATEFYRNYGKRYETSQSHKLMKQRSPIGRVAT